MNEIAMHSAEEKSWWIPGKYWPNLYLVKLLD
jgi:glutamine cyclotransferase